MKNKRHSAILSIINSKEIKTHSQLVEELNRQGFCVTQATVSRDMKELGLVKRAQGDGSQVYAQASVVRSDGALGAFAGAVLKIDSAMNMIVVKTYPGMASGVAASIDAGLHEQIMGSIAGDDTIFVMTADEPSAQLVCMEIRRMFE